MWVVGFLFALVVDQQLTLLESPGNEPDLVLPPLLPALRFLPDGGEASMRMRMERSNSSSYTMVVPLPTFAIEPVYGGAQSS